MILVYFVYGLAFFILGFSIYLCPKKNSNLKLAKHLWLIGAFGILHGLNEWIEMFILIRAPFDNGFLNNVSFLILPASFLFLILFGVRTLIETDKKYQPLKVLPVVLPLLWIVFVLISRDHILIGKIMARYLLATSGTVLTGLALTTHLSELKRTNASVRLNALRLAASTFFLYGVFSGLVVQQAAFPPASVLNYLSFAGTIGIPVQILRAFCAVLLTICMIRVLRVFDWEARKNLQESEDKFRSIFENATDGIMIADAETKRHIEANRSMCIMLGYSRDEIVGLSVDDIHPKDALPAIRVLFEKKLRGDVSLVPEVPMLRKDRSVFYADINSTSVILGGKLCLAGIFRDITERKQSETTHMETYVKLQALLQALPDAVFFKDTSGRYLMVNKAFEHITGAKQERVIGKTDGDFMPADIAEGCRKSDEEIMKSGTQLQLEDVLIGEDGGKTYLESVKLPLKDHKGDMIGLVGVSRDITARKKAEEKIHQSEKFIRSILETVDEGFIVIDRDYKIISANKAYLDQVKMPLEKVIGSHCYEVSHRTAESCHKMGEECAVKRTFDSGEPHTALHIHHDEEKNPIYVETKAYPLKDASGYTISAIEVINNTTEKKNLEDQLRHSQKMEAVGQLAGGVAHDFNNILTAITGYGCLIKTKMSEHDPLRNYLQQMLDASDRAANLTRSLLAFSRKQVISPRPVDLNKIIENVEKLLQRLISEDVEMKVNLANKDLIVMADSSQVEQILMNLVTNASDAMLERGCLTISTDAVVLDHEFVKINGFGKPGMYAFFSITDTGEGMDEKTKRKIFEPFFTTKEMGRGTGLGLSIAYGIVKQHDGYITCSSEPNRGTTFKIYLPLIKRKTAKTKSAVLHPVSNGTETILVAEDDAAVNKLVKEILEQYGYTVIEAVDGEDAVSKFKNNRDRVKLLILDVIMPKKNGKEVYEEIRKDRPDIKVIFSSGYTADILNKKKGLEGDFGFISKPASPTELLRKVRETLDKG